MFIYVDGLMINTGLVTNIAKASDSSSETPRTVITFLGDDSSYVVVGKSVQFMKNRLAEVGLIKGKQNVKEA